MLKKRQKYSECSECMMIQLCQSSENNTSPSAETRAPFKSTETNKLGSTSDEHNSVVTSCDRRHPQSGAEGQESGAAVMASQRAAGRGGLPGPVRACQMEHRVGLCARPTESNCMCWVVVVVVGGVMWLSAVCSLPRFLSGG